MKEIIQRLKVDIAQQSGTSPSFLEDLRAYMCYCETLEKQLGDIKKRLDGLRPVGIVGEIQKILN